MNEDAKKELKQELTDEQVDQVAGGYSKVCWQCKRTFTWTTTMPVKCPYCGAQTRMLTR